MAILDYCRKPNKNNNTNSPNRSPTSRPLSKKNSI